MSFHYLVGFDAVNYSITQSSEKPFLTEKLKISKLHQLGSDFCEMRRNST